MLWFFVILQSFTVSAADGSTGDGLDRDQVMTVMQKGMGPMIQCYEPQLKTHPGLEGRISLSLDVNAEGMVDTCKIAKSTLQNQVVEDCVVRECGKLVFPKPAGGKPVHVNYPFEFKRLKSKK